jgi:hypothetical protein
MRFHLGGKEDAIRERVWNIIAPHVNLAQKQWSSINDVAPVEKQSRGRFKTVCPNRRPFPHESFQP